MVSKTHLWVAWAFIMMGKYVSTIEVDINEEQSIRSAAAIAVFNTMSSYTSNRTGEIPGNVGVSWWQSGVLMDILIQYWYFTGDTSNNPAVDQAMHYHQGENNDYFSDKWNILNDDHLAWGHAAMTAAEVDYPSIPSGPDWNTLAEGVFYSQISRWDNISCKGGVRLGILLDQSRESFIKNAAVNGGLFHLAARLARFTGSSFYADWAGRIWDWSAKTQLLNTDEWWVNDAVHATICAVESKFGSLYNFGQYIRGTAYMYNATNGENPQWKTRLDGLLERIFNNFFDYWRDEPKVLVGHELYGSNGYENIAKGLFAADLAFVTMLAPYTAAEIIPRLQASAIGAARQCSGGDNHTLCNIHWGRHRPQRVWDGAESMEEQMSATAVISASLIVFKNQSLTTGTSSYIIDPVKHDPDRTESHWRSWAFFVILLGGLFLIYKKKRKIYGSDDSASSLRTLDMGKDIHHT
ncbi:hypothetical protein CNMCM5793_004680 [Aspergillus hiratsukae]|uniref:Mannan endo-1,6-alpha-mannosidase n=1 Tax=Aspergillus hiratsukae TaxID=1194566 RepID=A0A8H6PFD2_9EURO|nr:hypothetical protein CNMCM5793_004680 [Aspergillus hiratsukae]